MANAMIDGLVDKGNPERGRPDSSYQQECQQENLGLQS